MAINSNNPSFISAKVKKTILDGFEIDENSAMSADKWGGPNAVGRIFYKKVKSSKTLGYPKNIDQYDKVEKEEFDGTALPLFPHIKYHPLINEIVTIINLASKDYNNNRTSTQNYYFPPINLWNNAGTNNNILPSLQNYIEGGKNIPKTEDYNSGGLIRKLAKDEGLEIPLGNYFREQLNIHPLQPYEGDYLLEGRFGNSVRFGATSRSEVIPEESKNNWSNGAKGKNGDPVIIIRNGQSIALNDEGNTHTSEDINFDPSSIYLTSNQKIDNFIVASDAWNTFGINASIPQNDQNEATKLLDNPAEFIQDKPLEVDKNEKPKDKKEEKQCPPGQVWDKELQQCVLPEVIVEGNATGSIDYAEQDQAASGSLATSGSLDTETSGSISEEEAGLVDEDTTEYYQTVNEGDELEAIERPPLPESYAVASGQMQPHNNCGNCKFQENNQCNKWGAKVRAKHEDPWWCDSYKEIVEFAWNKLPNSTRKGRGGYTASVYKAKIGFNTHVYWFVESTEEGFGYMDENLNGKDGNKDATAASSNPPTIFPFKNAGSKGWIGFNEAEGKTIEEASPKLFPGVSKFNKLNTESDLINLIYQMKNWGSSSSNNSTWPYTLLNSQIFDPEDNYNSPLNVEVSIKTRDYEKDTTAGIQLLVNKAKEDFIKKLHKMERELKTDFKITLNEGSSKTVTINGNKSKLITSFKIINLVDTYSG